MCKGIEMLSPAEKLTQFEISTIATDIEYNNLPLFEHISLDDKRETQCWQELAA